MNRRLRKKAERRRRNQIHKLLDLVLDINGLEPRKQEVTGNLPTAFFEFHGHIGVVEISVHTKGWYPDADKDKGFWIPSDQKKLADGIQKLKAVKAETPAGGAAGESK